MIRVVQIRSRNPALAAVLGVLVLLVVLAVLLAGATLLAGAALVGGAVGGAVLLARRVLRLGRGAPPALPPREAALDPTLDPANEVFPAGEVFPREERRQLPPAP